MPDPLAPTGDDAERWLAHHAGGTDHESALDFFDGRPAVTVPDLIGRWRGRTLRTGSPLDGLLEAYGWYGKEFLDAETVHPLVFADRSGRPRPVNPALLPVGVLRSAAGLAHLPVARAAFRAGLPLLWTRAPAGRLRTVEHRGVATAALVYDALPIIDVFRRVSRDTVLGLMDMRGFDAPFFFVLQRDPVS